MKKRFVSVLIAVLLLSSCIGVTADIVLRANGSGSIALEYRVSRMLEELGKMDGNKSWPIIPTGRADIERTVKRIEGLTLRSFSVKEGPQDLIYTMQLDFANLEALIHFLDATGNHATLTRDGAKTMLSLTLTGSVASVDPDLLTLFTMMSAPYSIALSFSAPTDASLSLSSAKGAPLDLSGATVVSRGKKVSFAAPISTLLNVKDGAAVNITW
ncbi:MAG: hypothetical protein LBS86_01350 [Treponema sp.]|jgi:hypothetical protein|nr:hypothetical protein [Treponema sp.]